MYARDQGNMISFYAQSLASKLQSLVAFHVHTLKHVTIQGITFQYANDLIDVQDFDEDRMEAMFSLPELKLKKLRMRTQDMTLVPAGTAIKVEHVVFSTQTDTSYKPTISPAHLEKFTISNPVLKRLEFEHPTDECAPGLIPALIHCLSKLYQQGRGLDELVLDSIMFDGIDIREFFTTMGHLSHQHGTTLVLTPKYYQVFSLYQREFVDLGKDFQEIKIKKIVCNMRDHHDDPPQLSPLAEEVVVNYPRCFYTASGRTCCL